MNDDEKPRNEIDTALRIHAEYPVSDFPQGLGWPRYLERCDYPGCAYWKKHTCEHAAKRCERHATPCILPVGHGGDFCGAPPEFKIPMVESFRKAQGVPIHLNVGDPVHWISLCGYAERETEAKFACGKDVVTCNWCRAMILIAETKVKDEIEKLQAKTKTDATEITHLYGVVDRLQKKSLQDLDRIGELQSIIIELRENQTTMVTVNSRIGKRNAWRCSCGAETWALQQDEKRHLVAEHLKPSGEMCEKSKTVQEKT